MTHDKSYGKEKKRVCAGDSHISCIKEAQDWDYEESKPTNILTEIFVEVCIWNKVPEGVDIGEMPSTGLQIKIDKNLKERDLQMHPQYRRSFNYVYFGTSSIGWHQTWDLSFIKTANIE